MDFSSCVRWLKILNSGSNLDCWWAIMVWKTLPSWVLPGPFQGPEHSSYSLTFQTRTCTLCLGVTFETQLHSSGSSCLPWISFCSDRPPPSLTSHLWGRIETGSIKLSERKDNYNILGCFLRSHLLDYRH